MKNLSVKILSLSVLIGVAACENASETVINIPNVQVGCTTDDDANCSNLNVNPVTAFVRMSRSGCGSSINFEPIATGSVVMNCDAAGCDGIVSSWINPDTLETVSEILTGRMDVCSQVDINNSSGLPDAGDLVQEDSINISSSATITVDQWGN